MSKDHFEQVFQVSSPAVLLVKNIRGSVRIEPGSDGEIHISATRSNDTGCAERTAIELTQEPNGTVSAIVKFPTDILEGFSGRKPCKVDFIIQAPPRSDLNVNTISSDACANGFSGKFCFSAVSGNLDLHDLTGVLDLHTVSGDMVLERVYGPLQINTVSGNISGSNASGALQLESVSGDVHLQESHLPSVKAGSVSGNLKLQTPLVEGPYHFHTVSGEVQLTIPAETQCSAELHSLSGHISTTLPGTARSRIRGMEKVEIQGGGIRVSLNSVSGELLLAA